MIQPGNLAMELAQELNNILEYWTQHTIDREHGGFYGRIGNDNVADTESPKGLVLNARILWTFSAAYNFTGNHACLPVAGRAFEYLINHFFDRENGGFYWSVDSYGRPLETKKQVYGIAFCCYAFAEYYRASRDIKSLLYAKHCFQKIEQFAFDELRTGYVEAFTQDWKPVGDLRLSNKDANEKKTMNTHLHVLEAYSGLYRSWPDQLLKKRISQLLANFADNILNSATGHLQLFFDENWNVKSGLISYGHDIEAAWLLTEAAETIDDKNWIARTKGHALQLAGAAARGLDSDGGLWYERENDQLVKQKHSWPQAEAMVGFYNAWQLSGDPAFLSYSIRSWQFIKQSILDKNNGEWFWGLNHDGTVMENEDKVGFWKCPYHSTRACMELMRRLRADQSLSVSKPAIEI